MERFHRMEMMTGSEAAQRLAASSVAVFGIGGVGSFAAEALARSGIGGLFLCDNDVVDITNINRQLIALTSTLGRRKVDVMAERIRDINPEAKVSVSSTFFSEDTAGEFPLSEFDYIVDAIDSVASKLTLVEAAKAADVPVISSMGTGNKLDPARFEIADISETSVCPLARAMRSGMRKRGLSGLKVLYSREEPVRPAGKRGGAGVPASISFVPSAAGLMIAGEVIRDIIGRSGV